MEEIYDRIHQILKSVWNRDESADEGLELIKSILEPVSENVRSEQILNNDLSSCLSYVLNSGKGREFFPQNLDGSPNEYFNRSKDLVEYCA